MNTTSLASSCIFIERHVLIGIIGLNLTHYCMYMVLGNQGSMSMISYNMSYKFYIVYIVHSCVCMCVFVRACVHVCLQVVQ